MGHKKKSTTTMNLEVDSKDEVMHTVSKLDAGM